MTIFLSHISALQMIRHNPDLVLDAPVADVPKFPTASIEPDEAQQIASAYHLTTPIRIIVGHEKHHYRTKHVIRFLRTSVPPYIPALKISAELIVCSPQYLLVLLSKTLGFTRTVMLCCEFCGTYSIDKRAEFGFSQHDPFTTIQKWRQFCAKNSGIWGLPALSRALDFAFDNSASPRETKVAILLTFPRRLGGYGLPKPLLNYAIKVKKSNGETTTLRCDLYWPKEKLAIEYESDMTHTGAKRITEDSERRDLLASRGIRLLTITNGQLKDAVEMHALARTIRIILGIRSTRRTPEWVALNQKLRAELGLDSYSDLSSGLSLDSYSDLSSGPSPGPDSGPDPSPERPSPPETPDP